MLFSFSRKALERYNFNMYDFLIRSVLQLAGQYCELTNKIARKLQRIHCSFIYAYNLQCTNEI